VGARAYAGVCARVGVDGCADAWVYTCGLMLVCASVVVWLCQGAVSPSPPLLPTHPFSLFLSLSLSFSLSLSLSLARTGLTKMRVAMVVTVGLTE